MDVKRNQLALTQHLKIYHRDRTWLHHFDLPEDPEKHGDTIMEYLKILITDDVSMIWKMINQTIIRPISYLKMI